MADTRLFHVTFRIIDELEFFSAALRLGKKRPPGLRLRHWFIAEGGVSYAVWEAADQHILMGVLDVEFGASCDYDMVEVNLLYG
jgi:hypothetical protein